MTESKDSLKLDSVRQEVRGPLKFFAEKLAAALTDNLRSITVIGSSLTEDYRNGQSNINTIVVLNKQDIDSLKLIAGMAKQMSKKKLAAPLLMTDDYIERSRDVFGIEFLDFQLTHQTILGEDLFEKLTFSKSDVRLQCERELKATLIRLRQGYIASASQKRLVRDIVISAVSGLTPLLRAMLWLKDAERPNKAEPTFTKAAEQFSIKADPLIQVRKWRYEKTRPNEGEITAAFKSIYAVVEQLTVIVDKFEV